MSATDARTGQPIRLRNRAATDAESVFAIANAKGSLTVSQMTGPLCRPGSIKAKPTLIQSPSS
jgi:hypothetical protein